MGHTDRKAIVFQLLDFLGQDAIRRGHLWISSEAVLSHEGTTEVSGGRIALAIPVHTNLSQHLRYFSSL